MKAINAKSLGASLIVLVFSFITAPAAMADATMYPGSMCTHELAGSGGTLDRQSARIRTSTRGGTVVTCPIMINVPLSFQAAQRATSVDYSVDVRIQDPRNGFKVSCMVRIGRDGSNNPTRDTAVQTSSGNGFSSRLIFNRIRFLLPLREWAVLRCQLHPGSSINAYTISTTDF